MLAREFMAEDALSVLRSWLDDLENHSLERPLRSTLPVWHAGFEENFMRAQGPDGAPWLPRKDTKPHPLLIHYGPLIEAVRDTGNPGHIDMVGYRVLTTGVNGSVVPYAAVHQFGGKRIPARPYQFARDDVMDKALVVFADECFEILVGV